jgi:hypothetical protein
MSGERGETVVCVNSVGSNSINAIVDISSEQDMCQQLWPASLADTNPCYFYVWNTLKIRCM